MKKIVYAVLLGFVLTLGLTGCGKEEEKSLASSLKESFEKEIAKESDISKVADKLLEEKIITTKMMKEEDTDYLPGFTDNITNYTKVVKLQPMIGTLPFIMYLFESDDPKALESELKQKADLRWNICVEAEEMEMASKDKYVFFIMAPKTLEE